jgi:hypothetical protein
LTSVDKLFGERFEKLDKQNKQQGSKRIHIDRTYGGAWNNFDHCSGISS